MPSQAHYPLSSQRELNKGKIMKYRVLASVSVLASLFALISSALTSTAMAGGLGVDCRATLSNPNRPQERLVRSLSVRLDGGDFSARIDDGVLFKDFRSTDVRLKILTRNQIRATQLWTHLAQLARVSPKTVAYAEIYDIDHGPESSAAVIANFKDEDSNLLGAAGYFGSLEGRCEN